MLKQLFRHNCVVYNNKINLILGKMKQMDYVFYGGWKRFIRRPFAYVSGQVTTYNMPASQVLLMLTKPEIQDQGMKKSVR